MSNYKVAVAKASSEWEEGSIVVVIAEDYGNELICIIWGTHWWRRWELKKHFEILGEL